MLALRPGGAIENQKSCRPLSAFGFPPVGDGFAHILAAPEISGLVESGLEKMIREEKSSYYDSHPPLRKRIAALEEVTAFPPTQDALPARALLGELGAVEGALVTSMNPSHPKNLQLISWDETGARVVVPSWRNFVSEHAGLVSGISTESLAGDLSKLPEIGSKFPDPKDMLLTPEQHTARARQLLAICLALRLVDSGWKVYSQPGELYLCRDNERMDPFLMVEELASKKMTVDVWAAKCQEL